MLIIPSVSLFLGTFFYGIYQLKQQSDEQDNWQTKLNVLMIQPNIPQRVKMIHEYSDDILRKIITLTNSARKEIEGGKTNEKIDVIVWPETTFPQIVYKDEYLLKRLQDSTTGNTVLIFGADRAINVKPDLIWYNSMFVLSKDEVLDTYDKRKLLPFGEYIPFRGLFSKIFSDKLLGTDCSPGSFSEVISVKNIPPFLAKICSESLYSCKNKQVKWILQILNDAWFSPPIFWQHFAANRLRTVEAGIPMVRVSNSGISAVFNRVGKVEYILPVNEEGYCLAKIRLR
jgi:apolipoprotein N-acyltransferase